MSETMWGEERRFQMKLQEKEKQKTENRLRLHSGYQDNWHKIENINWYTEISHWLINYH